MFDVPLKLRIAGLLQRSDEALPFLTICSELNVIPIGDGAEKIWRALALMTLEHHLVTVDGCGTLAYQLTADGLCMLLSTDRKVVDALASWK